MEYNSQKFIELLKQAKRLREEGKSLQKEDQVQYLNLLNYSVKISDHVHWANKSDYLNLIKDFVNLKIDGHQFVRQFLEIHRSNERTVQMLKTDLKQLNNIEPNPKSFGFTKWTSEIYLCCDEFYPDLQPQDNVRFKFAKSEEQLRAAVANLIPQIEKMG